MTKEEEIELADLRRRYSEESRGGPKLKGYELLRLQNLEEFQANEQRAKPGYGQAPFEDRPAPAEYNRLLDGPVDLDPFRRYR